MEIFERTNEEVIKDQRTSRFNGAGWFETARRKSIVMIGCGGTGSFSALTLSRFSPKSIDLYDNDVIEEHNMSGQFFAYNQVGMSKVDATATNILKFTGYQNSINIHKKKFGNISEDMRDAIIVMAMDEPDLRGKISNDIMKIRSWVGEKAFAGTWVIDCRLGFDTLQLFTFPANSITCQSDDPLYPGLYQLYSKKIAFSSSQADRTTCSMKQTTFMANMIGSFTACAFESICSFESEEMRPLPPFFIEFNFNTFIMRCEDFKTYKNGRE